MAPADDAPPLLKISVAYSPRAGEVDEVSLLLPAGATVADALRQSGLAERHPGLAIDALPVGVWGAFRAPTDLLRDRDRVELYRPLLIDPKEARRLRYRGQRKVSAKPPRP